MSQVNFFMDEHDDAEFIAMLRARSDTEIRAGLVYPGDPSGLASGLPPFGPQLTYVLTNKTVPPRPACPPGELRAPLDLYKDLHIECTRSWLERGTLVSGRIYSKIGWLDTPEANRIGKAWYASIERWIKKRYRRHENVWWIGPSAEKWSLAGGRLAVWEPNALIPSPRNVG